MSASEADRILDGINHFIHQLDLGARRERQSGLLATFRTAGGGEKGQQAAADAANLRRPKPQTPQKIHL